MKNEYYSKVTKLGIEIESEIEKQIDLHNGEIRFTDLNFEDVEFWDEWYEENEDEITSCQYLSVVDTGYESITDCHVLALKEIEEHIYKAFVVSKYHEGGWHFLNDCGNLYNVAQLLDTILKLKA